MSRSRLFRWSILFFGLLALLVGAGNAAPLAAAEPADADSLILHTRKRVETKPGSGRFHAITEQAAWDPRKTAVVLCDLWDKHTCPAATRRVAELAPRVNALAAFARKQGALIIHCPSGTMDFYKETPQRKRAQAAPPVETSRPLELWCHLDEAREGKLPIDDSDGGCDGEPRISNSQVWTRQNAAIEIAPPDAITDSAEAFYLMKQQGIENVLMMGVHTNMCVLGRPFSIRQMVYQGMNVVLVRDLTDTMYNPRKSPFVHHCTGTDLVIEHIEKHWCPTITSADLLGGSEFRFSEDKRPHVVFVIADDEYKTEQSLPEFAARHLGKEFRATFVFGSETERNDLPGLDVLKDADVLVVSARRRALPARQLALIRDHIAAGKPVVGLRTASHAFALRKDAAVPEGSDVWPTFDPEILGGHYTGHHGAGPKVAITAASPLTKHPILDGVDLAALTGNGSLYKVSPLARSATPLLTGTVPDHPAEPIAWTNAPASGSRVFYTSLGHPDDFAEPAFVRLMVNALRWASAK
jgi:type 1 glutamine amidotransferase/nicotinamidase-related amidase